MDLRSYYYSLTPSQREAYAKRCGTSVKYFDNHLMLKRPSRIPRRELLTALADKSKGNVSFEKVISHFFQVAA